MCVGRCGMAFVVDVLKETQPLVVSRQRVYAENKCVTDRYCQ